MEEEGNGDEIILDEVDPPPPLSVTLPLPSADGLLAVSIVITLRGMFHQTCTQLDRNSKNLLCGRWEVGSEIGVTSIVISDSIDDRSLAAVRPSNFANRLGKTH